MRRWVIVVAAVLLGGAGPRPVTSQKAAVRAPARAAKAVKKPVSRKAAAAAKAATAAAPAPIVAPAPAPPPPPVELWDFDGLPARVLARGETTDAFSSLALEQLGIRLEGIALLKVSAHPNLAGGVTLRIDDPNDPRAGCAITAQRDGEGLRFEDNRCEFPILRGRLRTQATCRGIRGRARRVNERLSLEASSSECSAAPMGLTVSIRAAATPQ